MLDWLRRARRALLAKLGRRGQQRRTPFQFTKLPRHSPDVNHYAPSSTALVLREELVLASSGVQMGAWAAGSK